ncbi:LLM class flavin-dependent oxidoreductase [Streptomyces litchfieldiae]|uniref:LLM class flavin-dependent oxidoreductase n=1 Tax=Streptomyces litchfieldiae TaxID=3075543 RepID=A0ABU2MTS6_9ACTN|nr:LLM class flavin-dependent oxidoreductase [Streptomyces sp. DSM 44938]MDT0343989.1 LLM class flavin-dependent oxidoreductase [Streptomyces sp. DSM 44938]
MTAATRPARYGLLLPNAGTYADPRLLVGLARTAEDSGWDGVFLWDHLMLHRHLRLPVADTWTAVTAILASTRRIICGPLVTPLAARQPWKVARETATLDQLSGGRVVLGVGLGASGELDFAAYGDDPDLAGRAARTDEALALLDRLWSGEEVSHTGLRYRLDRVTHLPTPQRSRVPVWVAATWPARAPGPLRRALRRDGIVPMVTDARGGLRGPDPGELAALLPPADRRPAHWTVAVPGRTPPDDPTAARETVERHLDAGATWWLESFDPWSRDPAHAWSWARQGPPRPPAAPRKEDL